LGAAHFLAGFTAATRKLLVACFKLQLAAARVLTFNIYRTCDRGFTVNLQRRNARRRDAGAEMHQRQNGGAKTVAPKRWRQNGGAKTAAPKCHVP